jgi:hypothetical protein
LVFDPVQKTLLADQGEIRVGSKFQAEIPDKLAESKPRPLATDAHLTVTLGSHKQTRP